MRLKKRSILIGISIFLFLLITSLAEAQEIPKLTVFHSPTCHRCIEVKSELMPQIETEFKGRILIEYKDITAIENYQFFLSLREKYQVKDTKLDLPVFFLAGRFLGSDGQIKDRLREFINESLKAQAQTKPASLIDLVTHFKGFKPLAVISAGLIDGINPCAFTVIVFFISFLALQGYKRVELIIIGLGFIFAVFLTYLLIGLGIFGFLYRLKGFWFLVRIFNFSIGVFSIILGIFCLYDFLKFKKTKQTEGLILQLPKSVKNRINKIIGLHYRGQPQKYTAKLFLSALVTGFLVSILEAVCTGQVYLPTIAFVFKTTHLKLEAGAYLLLYNLMFILPLVIIFILALLGATSQTFSKFLKQNLLTVKVLMMILFFGLGIFLLWRA